MQDLDLDSMRQRLEDALRDRDRSMTEVSLAVGLSASYLHNILKRGQVPTVDKLHDVCRELGVSVVWVLYGLELP